jgi:hypothetical protein
MLKIIMCWRYTFNQYFALSYAFGPPLDFVQAPPLSTGDKPAQRSNRVWARRRRRPLLPSRSLRRPPFSYSIASASSPVVAGVDHFQSPSSSRESCAVERLQSSSAETAVQPLFPGPIDLPRPLQRPPSSTR